MKYLITGGLGFIGSHAVIQSVNEGNQCFVVDGYKIGSDEKHLSAVRNHKNLEIINCDIADYKKLTDVIYAINPDIILHFAAESHVDRSIENPNSFINSNIIGTFNLLECVRQSEYLRKNLKFIHISTDEVFGALGSTGSFFETSQIHPSSPYSASKAASDLMVLAWHKTYNLDVVVTNCSNNFGPHQAVEKFIPKSIRSLQKNVPVPVYGSGDNVRDWLYVKDHIGAIWAILEKGRAGERYNIGGGTELSNLSLLKLLWSHIKNRVNTFSNFEDSFKFIADRPGHDFRYSINYQKITKETGWIPQYEFHEALIETIESYLYE